MRHRAPVPTGDVPHCLQDSFVCVHHERCRVSMGSTQMGSTQGSPPGNYTVQSSPCPRFVIPDLIRDPWIAGQARNDKSRFWSFRFSVNNLTEQYCAWQQQEASLRPCAVRQRRPASHQRTVFHGSFPVIAPQKPPKNRPRAGEAGAGDPGWHKRCVGRNHSFIN